MWHPALGNAGVMIAGVHSSYIGEPGFESRAPAPLRRENNNPR